MLLGAIRAGAVGSFGGFLASIPGIAHVLAADAGADLGPLVTGAGTLTSGAVLGIVALKFSRGELVARGPDKVEQALFRVVEVQKADHDRLEQIALDSQALTREAITALARIGGTNP